MLFTDTDSLVYKINTDDVYEDFYENRNLIDFSDYPEDSKLFDLVNKKVIGEGGVNRLKRGVWIVCRFKRGLGKRRGYVFEVEGGGLRPQCTL